MREPGRSTGAVIGLLRSEGELTRAEIARRANLSAATVSAVVAGLLADGIAVERGPATPTDKGRRGRPGTRLSLNPRAGVVIGADFGHRHLRMVVVDLGHQILAETVRNLDTDYEASEGLALVRELVPDLLKQAGTRTEEVLGLGLGLPGPIDNAGRVGSSSILPGWIGRDPAAELRGEFGLDVWVDNDANLGALAEAAWGASRGIPVSAYLKLGAGIGCGLIIGGDLFRGTGGTAGEIGHTRVVANGGDVCRCGARGCLETVAGVPALVRLLQAQHGPDFQTTSMLNLAAAGDPGCRRVLADAGSLIGLAVANLLNLVNPQLVVVGGELAAAGELLLGPMRAEAHRNAVNAVSASPRIVPAFLGERVGALGAAALVLRASQRTVALPPLT